MEESGTLIEFNLLYLGYGSSGGASNCSGPNGIGGYHDLNNFNMISVEVLRESRVFGKTLKEVREIMQLSSTTFTMTALEYNLVTARNPSPL